MTNETKLTIIEAVLAHPWFVEISRIDADIFYPWTAVYEAPGGEGAIGQFEGASYMEVCEKYHAALC